MMKRKELKEEYKKIRDRTEWICAPLETEDYIPQPIMDVSPPRWHLAHTTWFFETFVLEKFAVDHKPYHPQYNFLFNSYYHHVGERWQRMDRGNLSRPTVKEVYAYRHAIDENVTRLIDEASDEQWQELSNVAYLGLQHEEQHQELLLYDLKYILANNPLHPVYNTDKKKAPQTSVRENKMISFEGGVYEIGYNGEGFSFDNEGPVHNVYVNDFALAKRPVTNNEYLEFMNDNGYGDFRHWLSDAWEVVQNERWRSPLYWKKIDGEWHEMTLNGLQNINPEAPVTHISYYEAEAFASWAGKRLPTEAEWEVAACITDPDSEKSNLLQDKYFHPVPPDSDSENPVQMLGDVWEWTQSAYLPYPGYRQAEGALGEYNGKFMVNQMVLRGGSCATPEKHIRLSYRNFFHPHLRWAFSGIRLAEER